MTDPTHGAAPEPEPNPVGAVYEQLTTAEKLTAIGALFVILTWLLGDLVINDYSTDDIALPLAIGIVGGIYSFFRGKQAGWHALYPWLIAMAALAIAILGFNRLLEDFRLTFLGGSAWLWRLTYYAGAGLLGTGGVMLLIDR